MAGAHLPLLGLEPVGGEPLMSVTRAWPVRRQTYGYLPSRKASPPIGWYQIIQLGDRDTNVRKHAHCHSAVASSGSAPQYLAASCVPVSTTASRQHLRSAASRQLVIPSHRLTTYGRRAFSVAGPMFWNSLPRHLRDASHTDAVFGRLLKTFLFSEY